MRFIVLGTSGFTVSCARALIDSGKEISAIISMPKTMLPLNSVDLRKFAARYSIPYFEIGDINSKQAIRFMDSLSPDYILSSWPKILGIRALGIPARYCIGTHPTELPFNRGRHPLHWLIVLGILETKLTFFTMDKNVDSGRILLSTHFRIGRDCKISEALTRMNRAAYRGTRQLCRLLHKDPSCKGVVQDHKKANYWRRRTPDDITLDPRMTVDMIIRTVRSFGLPYPCANLFLGKHLLKISDARAVKNGRDFKRFKSMEYGRIISMQGRRIRMKADGGIVDLVCKEKIPSALLRTRYIYPPSKILDVR